MPVNRHSPEFVHALEVYFTGDKTEGLEVFTSLARKHPTDPVIFLLLGNIKYGLGRLSEAIADYETAIKLQPDFGRAHYKLGVCAFRAGLLRKSLEHFEANLELTSQRHSMSNYWVGLVQFFLGNHEAAEEAWARLRVDSPESGIANFFLAQMKIKEAANREAVDLLDELIRKSPDFPEAHLWRARALKGLYRTFEAIQAFRKVLELNPKDKAAAAELETLVDVPAL